MSVHARLCSFSPYRVITNKHEICMTYMNYTHEVICSCIQMCFTFGPIRSIMSDIGAETPMAAERAEFLISCKIS